MGKKFRHMEMKTDLFPSCQVIVMHTKKPDQRLGKKSRFLLESSEIPNEGGRFAIEFVRYFFHFLHMKNYLFEMQYCSTNSAKIPSRFTDKVPFLADLSVSKTHFTDKPAFFSDLSVNFWPL